MSKYFVTACCSLLLLLAGWSRLRADSVSGNWPFVAVATTDGTTTHGGYYAKCVPGSIFGSNGATRIYRVENEQEVLVQAYDWYSTQIYVSGANKGISVVRFGPWNPGTRANASDLALGLYYDGKHLKSYSTLDIVGRPDNVQASVSHYTWCKRVLGYGHNISPGSSNLTYGFSIETLDGRILCFDVRTGELIKDARRVSSITTSSSSTNVVIRYAD